MSKRSKFGMLAVLVGAISLVALIAKPFMRLTYLWLSFLSIIFGGDVYDILESERYQSYYPPDVEVSTEIMEVDGEVFVMAVEEESIKNIFHFDPWGSSNQFVLGSVLIVKNKDNVALKPDIPFNHFYLRNIADEVSDIKSRSSDDLVFIWRGYEFSFDFNEEKVNVKALDE